MLEKVKHFFVPFGDKNESSWPSIIMAYEVDQSIVIGLRDLAYHERTPDGMRYLALISKATQRKLASDEEMDATFGPEMVHAIHKLTEAAFKHSDIALVAYKVIDKDVKTASDMKLLMESALKYKETMRIACSYMDKAINEVQIWIDNHRKTIPRHLLQDLLRDINAAHNNKWTQLDNVCELRQNGEIMTTKGGTLYGARSYFSRAPPLLSLFDWTLPITTSSTSFAILESEECAKEFRARMQTIADAYVTQDVK